MNNVTVIGAGLAGCEAAYQLSRRGINVTLIEMKPQKKSPAHTLMIPITTQRILMTTTKMIRLTTTPMKLMTTMTLSLRMRLR